MFCPSCSASNFETAMRCVRCGGDLLAPWREHNASSNAPSNPSAAASVNRACITKVASHILAVPNGRGFDDALARDFWHSSEDLWGEASVPWRWLKLWFAYFASGIAQIVVPITLVGLVVIGIRGQAWIIGLVIGVVIGTTGSLAGALIRATGVSARLRKAGSHPN